MIKTKPSILSNSLSINKDSQNCFWEMSEYVLFYHNPTIDHHTRVCEKIPWRELLKWRSSRIRRIAPDKLMLRNELWIAPARDTPLQLSSFYARVCGNAILLHRMKAEKNPSSPHLFKQNSCNKILREKKRFMRKR